MKLFRYEVRHISYELHQTLGQGSWITGLGPEAVAKALAGGFRVVAVVPGTPILGIAGHGFVFLSRRVWFWERFWSEFRQAFATEYKHARSNP